MAQYSAIADLQKYVRNPGAYIFPAATASADYLALAALAYEEINNAIRNGVAVPLLSADDQIKEIESLLVMDRVMRGQFGAVEQEASVPFRLQFRERAYELLDAKVFPASADAPTAGSANVGNGTLAVAVYDGYTFDSRWTVRCVVAGTATTAQFEVWIGRLQGSREIGGSHNWNLAEGVWPDASVRHLGDPLGLAHSVLLTMTAGATAFAVGDQFRFRTYSRYQRGRRSTGFRPSMVK